MEIPQGRAALGRRALLVERQVWQPVRICHTGYELQVVEMRRPRWGNPDTPGTLPGIAAAALTQLGVPRPITSCNKHAKRPTASAPGLDIRP